MLYPQLFSPTKIGSLALKNRIVRSATHEILADEEGHVTENYLECMRRLASGGVALIITGVMCAQPGGRLNNAIRVENESCLMDLAAIAESVHKQGNDCKVAVQIGHTGPQMINDVPRRITYGPSLIPETNTGRIPHVMRLQEIDDFVDASVRAVVYARDAGIDGVQLHAAHGWLLSSFLSQQSNHRDDQYGGDTRNRIRILTEIIERAHSLVGDEFPIMVKMNACDFLEDGMELEEALEMAEILEASGCVSFEVSSGTWAVLKRNPAEIGWKPVFIPEARNQINNLEDEAYHRGFARVFKERSKHAKIMLIGGLRTPQLMEEILANGDADLVSMCRPLIREPDLPLQWQNGRSLKSA